MDESELRALLQADDEPPPRAVTLADVHRRVRDIRRRRTRTTGGLLMAGLALVAAIVIPVRAASPVDYVWYGTLSSPTPTGPGVYGNFMPGAEIYRAEYRTGGRKERFGYDATGRRVGLTLMC
ncbi:hypothetical protein C1I98_24360, partial [Spongiactinospora gelatinilytica]